MKTINVSDEVYKKLLKMKKSFAKDRPSTRDLTKEYDWDAFFHDISLGEGIVAIEFIAVDGKPAEEHTITFIMGEKYGYQFKDGNVTEISPVPIPLKSGGVVYRMPADKFYEQVEVTREVEKGE